MKSIFLLNLLLLSLWSSIFAQRAVIVNGQALSSQTVAVLEAQYRVQIQPGRYWYDAVNGWWGVEGQAVAGLLHPGMRLGGMLRANASAGRTGVFINGRQINSTELYHLQRIVGQAIPAGSYWVDAYGNAGPAGGYATVNIYQAAQRGRSVYSRSFATDVGYGSNGRDFYIMGDGFSYTNF
jgi:hypothetical protein